MFPKTKADANQRSGAILDEGPFVHGRRTVHRAYFYSLRWSQVTEIKKLGWTIASITLSKPEWRNSVRTAYRLDSEPLQPIQDMYEAKHGARPKPQGLSVIDLPLFAGQRP